MRNVLPFVVLLFGLGCGAGQPAILSISAVTPASVSVGSAATIMVTGQRFDSHVSLLVGRVAVPVTVGSSESITAVLPPAIANVPGVYAISLVDAEPPRQGGTAVLPTSFTVTVTPAVP